MPNKHSILSLSLLSILAVLAVNASATSANWQLLRNSTAVGSVGLTVTLLLGQLLVPGLGLTIHCSEGTGSGSLSNTGANSGSAVFKGCKAIGPICTIENAKGVAGEIDVGAGGLLTMKVGDNENVSALATSTPNFTTVYMEGPKCTLPEEAEISGSGLLNILEALKDLKDHLAHLDDEGLFYGKEPATIDGASGAGAALAHIKEVSGGTWAVHLTGL